MKLERWLGPMPGRREAHAIAWMALAIGAILCTVSVALGFHGRTFLGRPLGGDFVEFYTAGKILNTEAPAHIYDLQFATRLQHAVLPGMPESQMLVFGQAPYIALLFRPFAALPYAWAYVAWLAFSAGLFIAALALLCRTFRLNLEDRKTCFLLALSSTPFLFETWIGGQVSVVVFLIWVLFFCCLHNDRPFLAGVAMALCLFKPTLVVVPALMLVLGRFGRVLVGLTTGGVAVTLLSFATVGLDGCRAWVATLATNAKIASSAGEAWHEAKYVDLLAFLHLLLPGQGVLANAFSLVLGLAALGWLGLAWWRSGSTLDERLWAATLCFTLVLNPYVPIYDSILAIIAVVLLASIQQAQGGWVLLLYLVPWVTQSFAEFLHLQLITLVLAGMGICLMEGLTEPNGAAFRLSRKKVLCPGR